MIMLAGFASAICAGLGATADAKVPRFLFACSAVLFALSAILLMVRDAS